MDFLIVGGGCFGSFYARQLLRGAGRLGVGRIHIVDHDPLCQAAREFSPARDPRLEFHFEDWKPFLLAYFTDVLKRRQRGETIHDQYVPPTFAPHILLEILLDLARRDCPEASFEKRPYDQSVGTPVDMALAAGTRALSFATWTCPATCIEPSTCPHTRGPKDWDMKKHLIDSLSPRWGVSGGESGFAPRFEPKHPALPVRGEIDSLHVFPCRHYAMGVGTIPVEAIVEEYLQFQKVIRVPGTHRVGMATVSSCHGLIGMVEVTHG